jgi:hypothetical protein
MLAAVIVASRFLQSVVFQDPPPPEGMGATEGFYEWWFKAWGIGGWALFLLIAIGAIAWLIYDTQTRRIRAVGWVMGAILAALLLLPSAYFSLAVAPQLEENPDQEIAGRREFFFYMVGYGITYQGMRGCEKGHVYAASLGECPTCAEERAARTPPPPPPPPIGYERHDTAPPPPPPPPPPPKANAWLVDERTNRTHQLKQGDTRVGRSKTANDVVFNDKAVSREHMLIREEGGHFTIYDRGARTGTFINGKRLHAPVLLDHDDIIEIGDTRLRFVTTRG